MIDFSENDIKIAYENSSDAIKDILNTRLFLNKVVDIAFRHKLRIDKTEILSTLVLLVLLDLIHINDFPKEVEENLGVSHDVAIKIIKDIDNEVFKDVRDIVSGVTTLEEVSLRQIEKILGRKVTEKDLEWLTSEEAKKKQKPWVNFSNDLVEDEKDDNGAKEKTETVPFKERYKDVEVKEKKEEFIDPYREVID